MTTSSQNLPFTQIASNGVMKTMGTSGIDSSVLIENVDTSFSHHNNVATPLRLQAGSIIQLLTAPHQSLQLQFPNYSLWNQNIPNPLPHYQLPPMNFFNIPMAPDPQPGPLYSTDLPQLMDNRAAVQFHMNMDAYDHVNSWNIKFSGALNENVQSFLTKVSVCQQACNMHEDDLFRVMPLMLTGIASIWWEERQDNITNFREFKHALIKRFSSPKDVQCSMIADILVRTQDGRELGADYLDNVRLMWRQSQDINFSTAARLDIAFINLRPEYREMITRGQFSTFNELKELVMDFDYRTHNLSQQTPSVDGKIYSTCAYTPSLHLEMAKKNNNSPSHEKNLIEKKNSNNNLKRKLDAGGFSKGYAKSPMNKRSSTVNNSDAVEPKSSDKSNSSKDTLPGIGCSTIKCFKCGEIGHPFNKCASASEEVFCWGCGAKGIKKPHCSKCGRRRRKPSSTPLASSEHARRD